MGLGFAVKGNDRRINSILIDLVRSDEEFRDFIFKHFRRNAFNIQTVFNERLVAYSFILVVCHFIVKMTYTLRSV